MEEQSRLVYERWKWAKCEETRKKSQRCQERRPRGLLIYTDGAETDRTIVAQTKVMFGGAKHGSLFVVALPHNRSDGLLGYEFSYLSAHNSIFAKPSSSSDFHRFVVLSVRCSFAAGSLSDFCSGPVCCYDRD